MSTPSENKQNYPDELTLKELVISTAQVILWTKAHFWKLVLFCIIFGCIGGVWAHLQEEKYVADLSFMLSDDNNPQVSGISSMFGQLGLPLSTGKYNVDKLLEISKKRFLIEETLLANHQVNGHDDLLANHFIDELNLLDKWSVRDEGFKNFKFKVKDVTEYTPNELYAMKALVHLIVGYPGNRENALFATDYGKTDYIMSFSLESPSQDLSIGFVSNHYDNVSEYYISRSVAKNQDVYNLILQDRDSLLTLIDQNALEIARLKDISNGSFRNTNNVRIALLENKLRTLQSAAQEVITNLGRAQYLLDTKSPLIQLLDIPQAPLFPIKPSHTRYALYGIFLGLVFYLCLLFFINVFREIR